MDWPRRVLRQLALRTPWLLRLMYRSLPDSRRHPERLVRKMLAGLGPPDRAVLARPDMFRLIVDHTAAALEAGVDGMADEVLLLTRPWGFALDAITTPVTLWCGTEDTAAPPAMAEHLAARIPGAELRRIDGEGHLALLDHFAEILASTAR
jgi:pimeloyl-ACP methyl ester carboxylesterase